MAYLILSARKAMYSGTSALFRQYGHSVAQHPGIYSVIGVLLAVLGFTGLPLMKHNLSIDTIWMESDNRFIAEQDFYVERFGSLPRLSVIANSMVNQSSAITPQSLRSMMKVLSEVTAYDKNTSISIMADINGRQHTMKADDFCERPVVPDMFKSTDPTDDLSYIRRGAFQSYGYVQLIKCLRRKVPSLTVENNPTLGLKTLPEGWGVEQFPCTRVTILDCFKEGEVDYPDSMRVLQASTKNMAIFMMNYLRQDRFDDAREQCLDEYESKLQTDLETLDKPNAAYVAAHNRHYLKMRTPIIFLIWGYHWRVSMERFKSSEELMGYIQSALEAPFTEPEYGIEQCLKDGLLPGPNAYPRCCMTWNGGNVATEMFLGQKMKEGDKWTGLSSVRHPMINQPYDNPVWRKFMKEKYDLEDPVRLEELINQWDGAMITRLSRYHDKEEGTGFEPGGEYEGVNIDLHSERSTTDMSAESAAIEAQLLMIGVGMLGFYSVVVMGSFSNRCINSNVLCMVLGFIVSGASVVDGVGVMSALGFEQILLSPLVALVGFIIGIGNIFILMFTFSSYYDPERSVRDNMTTVVEIGGHAVFLISVTLITGFTCGVYVPIPGLRSLAVQVACTVLYSFLLQMTLFVPVMVWNCRRAQDNRMDCVPIKRHAFKPFKTPFLSETKDLFKDYPTIKHSSSTESMLTMFARHIYGPLILNKFIRLIIIIASVMCIFVSVFVSIRLTTDGLLMSDVAKPGTYQASFAALTERDYEMFSSYLVTESEKYNQHQARHMKVFDVLESNNWLVDYPGPRSWDWLSNSTVSLTQFYALKNEIDNLITDDVYKQGRGGVSALKEETKLDNTKLPKLSLMYNASLDDPIPYPMFNSLFTQFMNDIGAVNVPYLSCSDGTGPADCTVATSRVTASRTALFMRNLTTHENFIASIVSLRHAVDDLSNSVEGFRAYVFGFTFSFWGMFINLRRNVVCVLGAVLVGVVVPIAILHCSLRAAFLIASCAIAGLFEVFAAYWVLGIKFNGFSLVPLVLSTALTVQWAVFVIHNFIGLPAARNKRARDTITQTFPAVLSGVLSLCSLMSPLLFTSSPFVKLYIALPFLVASLASFTLPMLTLPCILSLIGPRDFVSGCDEVEESEGEGESEGYLLHYITNAHELHRSETGKRERLKSQ